MLSTNKRFELSILVNEKPITEYEHEGNHFVEGRRGSDFSIYLKNNGAGRVLAIPSVDGLSIFDGQVATPDSKGYVLNGYSTLVIPGWTLDPKNVAKFIFQDKEKSYAASTSSGASKAGVIGVMFFDEFQAPPVEVTTTSTLDINKEWQNLRRVTLNDATGAGAWVDKVVYGSNPMINICSQNSMGTVLGTPVTTTVTASSQASTPMEMGTGFGAQTSFDTRTTQFNKGIMNSILSIYYDSARNLTKRGIQLVKPTRYDPTLPQPFSTTGCTPPPGWQK